MFISLEQISLVDPSGRYLSLGALIFASLFNSHSKLKFVAHKSNLLWFVIIIIIFFFIVWNASSALNWEISGDSITLVWQLSDMKSGMHLFGVL